MQHSYDGMVHLKIKQQISRKAECTKLSLKYPTIYKEKEYSVS